MGLYVVFDATSLAAETAVRIFSTVNANQLFQLAYDEFISRAASGLRESKLIKVSIVSVTLRLM